MEVPVTRLRRKRIAIVALLAGLFVISGVVAWRLIQSTAPDDSSAAPVPPVNTCVANTKVLMYDLQYNSTAPGGIASESQTNLANYMRSQGYNFTHGSRVTQPTITEAYLKQFDVVQFYNGCAGPVGMLTSPEIVAIYNYYIAGGDLLLIADDLNGDDTAGVGDCYSRVNQIAIPMGLQFTGNGVWSSNFPTAAMCVATRHYFNVPFTQNVSTISQYSPTTFVTFGPNTWGGGPAATTLSTVVPGGETYYAAYSAPINGRGSVTFMSEWAGFATYNCHLDPALSYTQQWNLYLNNINNNASCPVCGNGTIEAGEACDDGNTNNGDGCSSTCQIEPSSSSSSSSLASSAAASSIPTSSIASSSVASSVPTSSIASSSVASSVPTSSITSSSATTSIVSSVATSTPIAPVCLSLTQTSPAASVSYPPGTVFNYTAVFTCGGLDPNLMFKVVRADTGLDAGAVTVGSANYNSTNNQCTYNFTWTASGITTSGTYVVYLVGQGAPTPIVLSL